MDRDVTHKILYGPKRSWGPYTILWVTDRSINCHLARSAINYLLYYTQYMQSCHRRHVFDIVYLRQKTSLDKIRKKTLYWPAALTKTNRENKNVKYNINNNKTFFNQPAHQQKIPGLSLLICLIIYLSSHWSLWKNLSCGDTHLKIPDHRKN
jgi:hypothetical protein